MFEQKTDRICEQYNTHEYEEHEHYSYSFKYQFDHRIVPEDNINSRIDRTNYGLIKCTLDPKNIELEEHLINFLPCHYGHNNFNEKILDTIKFISEHLIHDGIVALEFVKQINFYGEEEIKLVSIKGKEVKVGRKEVVQILHEDFAKRSNSPKSKTIPKEKCYVIGFPKSMGGKNKYLKFINELKNIGDLSIEKTVLKNDLLEQHDYDLNKHDRLAKLEFLKKTKAFNWIANDTRFISSYYYVRRALLFKKSKILLRDYLIEELSKLINQVSEDKFGQASKLKVEGLMPLSELDKKLELWEIGKLEPKGIKEALR